MSIKPTVIHLFNPVVPREERSNVNLGVVTIAYSVLLPVKDDEPDSATPFVAYGVSYCSPRESKFDRKLGGDIASDRMKEALEAESSCMSLPNYSSVLYPKNMRTWTDAWLSILFDVIGKRDYPKWAKFTLYSNLSESLDPLLAHMQDSEETRYFLKRHKLVRVINLPKEKAKAIEEANVETL